MAIVEDAQVDPGGQRMFDDLLLLRSGIDREAVEVTGCARHKTQLRQTGGQRRCAPVDAFADRAQPFRAMVDRVHRRDHRQQDLRGADVRGRLFAADVLLARLQREAVGGLAAAVDRYADQPARHRALEIVAHRHVGGVRAAVTHRYAEALGRADRHVGAEFARRCQQSQRQWIGGDDGDGTGRFDRLDRGAEVADRAEAAWILEQYTEYQRRIEVALGVANDDGPAQRLGARAQQRDRLRMTIGIDKEGVELGFDTALGHCHGFGGSGGFIKQRGIGDIEAGELADHRLEIEQRFQPALADLRLVRRVRGVPGRVFQNVALDDQRQMGAVVALADQRGHHPVAAGDRAHALQCFGFAQRRTDVQRLRLTNRCRHGLRHQLLQRIGADGAQHLRGFARRGADMAVLELGCEVRLTQENRCAHGKLRRRAGLQNAGMRLVCPICLLCLRA